MASLTNTKIKDTYDGLLKTTDNDALGGTYKLITDGLGNSSGVYLGTGGNVGIGQSSPTTYKLDVNGTFRAVSTAYFESGINAASYIYHQGDTNTFFGFPANDTFTVTTNNAERMRIDSSGRVGIGTTSPSQKLSVRDDSTSAYPITLENSQIGTVGAHTGIRFGYINNLYQKGAIIYESQDSSGRGKMLFAMEGTADSSNADETDTKMTIDYSGKVGVGTTTPTTPLEVVSSENTLLYLNSSTATVYLRLDDSNSTNGNFIGASTDDMHFWTNNTERMRIDSSGNVQIGSGTRYGKFDILNIGGSGTNFIIGAGTNGDNYFTSGTSGIQVFRSGSTERMRITSGGNVGIGVIPEAWTVFDPVLRIGDGGAFSGTDVSNFRMFANTYYDGSYKRIGSGYATQYEQASGNHVWSTAATGSANTTISWSERMRITSGGDIQVGTTSIGTTARIYTEGDAGTAFSFAANKGNSTAGAAAFNRTDDGAVCTFYRAWAGAGVGSISVTSTATAYNTSSDYRLKENVVDMVGALDRVDQLEPKRFNFISDAETTVDGFIAHEVQSVIPEAITGEKDAVDDEGNPEFQGIDQSKIVPLLVGAIKELKAEIETLKSQINS